MIDSVLGCGADPCEKSGYMFSVERLTTAEGTPLWNLTATPQTPTGPMQTGSLSYYTNEIGVVYVLPGATPPNSGISNTIRTPTNGSPLGS
jgi:hypothetical protein